jgi:hypothetical protein
MSQVCKTSPISKAFLSACAYFDNSNTFNAPSIVDAFPSKAIGVDSRVYTKTANPEQERKVYERIFHDELECNVFHVKA